MRLMIGVVSNALVPIFAIIGLGVITGRRGLIKKDGLQPLNTLLMDFALPAAMFAGISRASRTALLSHGPYLAVLCAGMLLLWTVSFRIQRQFSNGSRGDAALVATTVALPNYAAVGIPLASTLFGQSGTVAVSLAIGAGAVLLSPLTLILLDLDRTARDGGTGPLRSVLAAAAVRTSCSPVILAPLAAILLVLLDIRLPEPLQHVFDLFGRAAGGIALFLTGLFLSARRPRFSVGIGVSIMLADIVHPLLSAVLAALLGLHGNVGRSAILFTALPSGFFGIFFAVRYGREASEAASVVAFGTVVSLLTLSLAIVLTAPGG
ncbi:AEC family transporter [Rhizosaccharibacter radicis]|uniref:AEC family transporter n=1 Tax=Rhizosaccharibacter radicis TaxID=2782605 RepID=A0ABT1VT98_9PROT|nr:AEC family transporter [Acetobacteraceae bacterium KSS12]